MRIVRYQDKSGGKLGAVKGEGVVDLTLRFPALADNTIELIRQWPDLRTKVEKAAESAPDTAA